MQKLMNGLIYNSATARLMAETHDSDDEETRRQRLYRTDNGHWFLRVDTARHCLPDVWSSHLFPLPDAELAIWLSNHAGGGVGKQITERLMATPA